MRLEALITTLFVALLLQGCSEPTIDASSDAAMKQSIKEVGDSLSGEKRTQFDQAIKTIIGDSIDFGSILRGKQSADSAGNNIANRLSGKNADQIISESQQIIAKREARQKEQAIIEISELEEKQRKDKDAEKVLENFVISKSRLYKREESFTEKPIIEMTVTNNTNRPIARAFFEGTVASPGRSVPWIEDTFNYQISGGIEPGETAEWVLAPNRFSDWAKDVPGDAILTLRVYKLEGPGYETDGGSFTQADAERLETLKSSYQ